MSRKQGGFSSRMRRFNAAIIGRIEVIAAFHRAVTG
jgi:hypothetical protein